MVRININVGGKPVNGAYAQHRPSAARDAKFLSSEAILRYLLGSDEQIETLILCKPDDVALITTDHNLYEALGSTKQYDNVQLNRLTKLLEVVDIISYRQKTNSNKPILKEERVEELRKSSLKQDQKQKNQGE